MSMPPSIAQLIRSVRGQRVILDADLATLYGVATKQFNQAFKRNRRRFPPDFAFQLSTTEFVAAKESESDRSQTVTGQVEPSRQMRMSSSQPTQFGRRRTAAYRPWAFTEHGALMAANILRSPRATEMSVFVIRAFVKMREELSANSIILRRLAEIDRTLLVHDGALQELYQKLLPLLSPPDSPGKPKIGFHPGNR